MKQIIFLLMICLLSACASSSTSKIEQARFALDSGDYNEAIEAASAVIADDSQNITAARLLASAYFGRSNIRFLDLVEAILDLNDNDEDNFKIIAQSLPEDGDVSDVRRAILVLEDLTIIDDTDLSGEILDAVYELAMMQVVEHFAIGIYNSDYFNSLDVTLIDDDDQAYVSADLINFDNRLINAGVDSSEDFLGDVRQTFCILEPISAGEGFTTAEYQAFVGCQLSDDPDNFDTTALTADISSCDDLDPGSQGSDVQDCYDEDTTL